MPLGPPVWSWAVQKKQRMKCSRENVKRKGRQSCAVERMEVGLSWEKKIRAIRNLVWSKLFPGSYRMMMDAAPWRSLYDDGVTISYLWIYEKNKTWTSRDYAYNLQLFQPRNKWKCRWTFWKWNYLLALGEFHLYSSLEIYRWNLLRAKRYINLHNTRWYYEHYWLTTWALAYGQQ